MAEHPENERLPRKTPQSEVNPDAGKTPRESRARDDEADPREEEGWTQPESSAQKGAEPNDND